MERSEGSELRCRSVIFSGAGSGPSRVQDIYFLCVFRPGEAHMSGVWIEKTSTAIGLRKHRIPSDLRS